MSTPPQFLYIYCTCDTANNILAQRKLTASSPICMDDPLLPNQHSTLGFGRDELLKSSINFAVGMIFSPAAPRGDSPIVNAIKRWREEQRFASTDEAEPVLRELLTRMIDHRMQQVAKRMLSWRHFIQTARVIRAFSEPAHVDNWQQLADNHRGLVLGFKTGETTLLNNAKPAEYSALRPEITTMKEQLNLLYQYQKQETNCYFKEILYCRPPHKKNQGEWLSEQAAATSNESKELSNEVAIQADELCSVRFGLQMSEQDRTKYLALVKKNFRDAKCYTAKLAKGKYELEFEKINP